MDDQFCTAAEAAQILHVSKPTVFRLIKRGDLVAYRKSTQPSSHLRVSLASLHSLQTQLATPAK